MEDQQPELEGTPCSKSPSVGKKPKVIKSPYYSKKNKDKNKKINISIRNHKKWAPPRSPFNLIQESLFDRPWHLLVATIFLNKTSGQLGTEYAWKFFEKWNSPEAVLEASKEELVDFLRPIGLQVTRASQIRMFSDQYLNMDWEYPDELYGIGRYGKDSYKIFCLGDLNTNPKDHMLKQYVSWCKENFFGK